MHYAPRFTYLASRLSDGATIAIPIRRHRRSVTAKQRRAIDNRTAEANIRSRRALKARGA